MHSVYITMIIAWVVVIAWVLGVIYTNRKVHPKALFLLFFAEMWERFSYYGMRALLILYMVAKIVPEQLGEHAGFGFTDDKAYGIYAAYGSLVYATPIIGGLLAEKFLGYRRSILIGGLLMAAGQFFLAFSPLNISMDGQFAEYVFFIGLCLLVIGNGYFKPNISSFVGKFYGEGDPRRDGGFTLFYMGINVGAFLTPLTCGAIGELEGWEYGFGIAGFGMLLGLIVFLYGQSKGVFEDKGLPPKPELLTVKNNSLLYGGTILAIPLFYLLINQNDIVDVILGILGLGILVFLTIFAIRQDSAAARDKIFVIMILLLFTTMFWTFFELAGSAINLFTERNVDRHIMGTEIPTSVFQSVNPAFIILLAPVFTWVWGLLGKRKLEPPAPYKFSAGLILLGLGFGAFVIGKGFAHEGLVPLVFLVMAYLLHTLGELCLSPVGLSLVTKLAPAHIVGLLMGIWFMSSSIAHQAGKHIAQLTSKTAGGVDTAGLPAAEALDTYIGVFGTVGLVAVAAGLLLLVLSPFITKWMHGVR
jgi:POT family proton-dependent oligopeptide transporter